MQAIRAPLTSQALPAHALPGQQDKAASQRERHRLLPDMALPHRQEALRGWSGICQRVLGRGIACGCGWGMTTPPR